MVVNVYAIVAGSVAVLQLLLGLALSLLGVLAWRRSRACVTPEQREAIEDRSYLLFMVACILAGLSAVSWPLLYLVLQSYVPQWPGVMCIYGVMRVGTGSEGVSGHLPRLLGLLQVLKPAMVFLTGAWIVLYSAHRRSQTSWLLRRVLALLLIVGLMSSLDAAAEIAYLGIPKKNVYLASGCCPVPTPFATALAEHGKLASPIRQAWLHAAYLAATVGMLLGLWRFRASGASPRRLSAVLALVAFAAVSFWVGLAFLTDVITPAALRTPGNHCIYDLVQSAPATAVAIAFLAMGSLSAGWAGIAGRLAGRSEAEPFIRDLIGRITRRGQYAYLISMALIIYALLGARP